MGLTERRIRDAQPGPKPVILWDAQMKGLGVKIQPGGTKAFILDYRVDGRQRRATIARCSEISLREARERAGAELVRIRAGETDPLERRREAKQAPTIAEGVARFFAEEVPRRIQDGRLSERTAYDYRKQAERTILPNLGPRKIADVSRVDIERAIDNRGRVQRNRTLSLLNRLFNLWERWEWRAQATNPCRHIEKAREEPRDRTLSASEIARLAAALEGEDNTFMVAYIEFMLLTGWRPGEARTLRWDEVNFETGVVRLPTTKTGRSTRTVSAGALQSIADLPRLNGNPYVFPGARGQAPSEKTTRAFFARVCRKAGIEDARLHDLRRTVATTAAASGLSVVLLRDLLNHKSLAMANRYARQAGSALRVAQDDAADRMSAMMRGETGEVVPLHKSG